MKKLLVFVLFPMLFYAQHSIVKPKHSVIALDKLNVIYRGIDNPITVAVPNGKEYWVSGPGVSKTNELGKYIVRPGKGNELKILVQIKFNDDSIIREEHVFQIKGLPRLTGTFNDEFSTQGLLKFSKDELKDGTIGIKLIDFFYNVKFNVISFKLMDENKNEVVIEGNSLSDNGFKFIKKLKNNSLLFITDIRYSHSVESNPKIVNDIIILLD